ncbi:MAG: site-specific integrase [Bifidobacteriaceae bacterium]|jgi:integrase|nr:site-specific integrase [Bifidobacteriaceae bacterium]
MSKVRQPVGTFGEIHFNACASGRVRARCRYRDWDGVSRLVQATGADRNRAALVLKAKLAAREVDRSDCAELTADSTFGRLAQYWLADLELEGRLAKQTITLYASNTRRLVLPAFEHLTLREIGVARCDMLLKQLANKSHSRAASAKVVLRLAFGLAVRHEVIVRNPMDGVARLHKPARTPDALTPDQVNQVRAAVREWEAAPVVSGPKPDGQLSAMIEVILGTSARIGEALAIRRSDLDMASDPPTVAITGTIITRTGEPTFRQDHPKTAKSQRVVAIPSFTAAAIRRRLADLDDARPDALLFQSRAGTPLITHNVRGQLRRVIAGAGLGRVTPHTLRRTVATEVKRSADVDLAAELLGHTDKKITIEHYIRPDGMVDPSTAGILEQALKPDQ